MPISAHFDLSVIASFLLTMTRVGCALFLLPLPGFKDISRVPRIVLVLGITICLAPAWPKIDLNVYGGGQFLMAALGESTAGLLLGLAIAFLHEAFQLAAQAVSLQSGFSFASVFDPSSKADSSIFQVLTQFATGLLFFITDVHHHLIRLLGRSFDIYSTQNAVLATASLKTILTLASDMFTAGLKMGIPLVILLLLIELSLALLSRLHAQLQLMTLTFPVKTGLSFLFLALMMARWPILYEQLVHRTFALLDQLTPF